MSAARRFFALRLRMTPGKCAINQKILLSNKFCSILYRQPDQSFSIADKHRQYIKMENRPFTTKGPPCVHRTGLLQRMKTEEGIYRFYVGIAPCRFTALPYLRQRLAYLQAVCRMPFASPRISRQGDHTGPFRGISALSSPSASLPCRLISV